MLRAVLKQNAEQRPHLTPENQSDANIHYAHSPWNSYFDERIDVKPFEGSNDSFGVYIGSPESGASNTVFFFLHGAGQSALSWAVAASIVKTRAKVYAMDFRGHGTTRTQDDSDLSAERMCQDVEAVTKSLFQSARPNIILVGHSMGGAIAARVSDRVGALGVILVDIVEGTARAAYGHIRTLIDSRPKSFMSASNAISWSLATKMLRNPDSACVSIPSQLVPEDPPGVGLRWRTDLAASQQHWDSWYVGLSELFLRCKATKALLLAGIERLDKTLTIGQIQGKFQLTILPVETGHSVQEDAPKQTANTLLEFYTRYAPAKGS